MKTGICSRVEILFVENKLKQGIQATPFGAKCDERASEIGATLIRMTRFEISPDENSCLGWSLIEKETATLAGHRIG